VSVRFVCETDAYDRVVTNGRYKPLEVTVSHSVFLSHCLTVSLALSRCSTHSLSVSV